MNPYEVLGVEPGADEETIKRAHRALVKKYHPDRYVDNPLADLAAEKMKEINKAYDMLMKGNKSGTQSGGSQQGYGGRTYSSYGGYSRQSYDQRANGYQSVRMLINMGQLVQAMNVLNSLEKNAEWYYLHGIINIRRGYYDQSIEDLNQAIKMDPSNVEYRSALENIQNRTTAYNNTGAYGRGDMCDCMPCTCLCYPCCCC